jgi:predicted Rossmann fold flavoprotein
MCAVAAGKRGRRVLVLDHAPLPGRKLLLSGGGRCNFTNQVVTGDHYIASNPHFVKSALSRFTPRDFLALLEAHAVPWEERDHGRLFCTGSASEILDLLLVECRSAGVTLITGIPVTGVERQGPGSAGPGAPRFQIWSEKRSFTAGSLVIATGGLSIPGIGAGPFGYRIAEQFGIRVRPTRPGLVPLTLNPGDRALFAGLAGVSVDARVTTPGAAFQEKLLFTHRGLSGPVILQISSYWQPGGTIVIDLLPGSDLAGTLKAEQSSGPRRHLRSVLAARLPRRLVDTFLDGDLTDTPLGSLSHERFRAIARTFQAWSVKPGGSEGYRTAEVTVGGVDCDGISSRTMEARAVPGLYFIGEVLDVTGQLGGYNLHWAWASGLSAGQSV